MARRDLICTIGPRTRSYEVLSRWVEAGATGFRVPFSKETPDKQFGLLDVFARVKASSPFVRTFADLPGQSPRTQNQETITFGDYEEVSLADATEGCVAGSLAITYFAQVRQAPQGQEIAFGDGEVTAIIVAREPNAIRIRITRGGVLNVRRTISWVGCGAYTTPNSLEDDILLSDSRMAAFDGVMISHVGRASQLDPIRQLCPSTVSLVSKVESSFGLANLADIAAKSDAILVGLGDLANDTGQADLYRHVELAFAWKSSHPGRTIPLWLGTQLLEVTASGATSRAELLCLGFLVSAGIDGILLSSETTIGEIPENAIKCASLAMNVQHGGVLSE